jgi:transcriptional regulator with XRE-family HTH domain
MTPDRLRARLRERRIQLGLTQDDVAELVGVSERTFQKWEQGSLHPATPALVLWAQALHWEVRVTHLAEADWVCSVHGPHGGRYCPACVEREQRFMREECYRLESRIHDLTRGVV